MRKLLLLALLAACSHLLFWPTALQPVAWQPGPVPKAEGVWAANTRLDGAVLEQSGLDGPDTVVVDGQGRRYSGIGDGRILRWTTGAEAQTFVTLAGRPVGMNFGPDGSLYAADEANAKVWRITPDGQAQVLVQSDAQQRFTFLNDVFVARDGRLFFTEASSRWGLAENKRALLEHGGDGGVFVRDPDGRIERVMDGLQFANGVVLSPDESYLLVAETGAYRITRLWIQGPRSGQREVLVDNLPGFPGDLSIAPDGSYWCSFFSPRKAVLDALGPWPFLRKVASRLPPALLARPSRYPHVFRFDGEGRVLESLQASPGSELPSFSSVVQVGNELLLGTPGGVGEIDADRAYRVPL
ncbi:SMP-30/gluconolactonase/LRE family protein [Pseudomonas sp. Gutcm_11s]|uniref:SMP-30/gluconolactonase/LRE family protein n=1 Tax=Pseudomonas sp. Gutcm_11s TaxID=3026088 RepID=UPI0023619BF9|nr:SMP-30/gluconolactonase/LRE family protein [Pseudomonas sp. Gutcm_11s]MDD0841512.1 SMP-30/gluconolactonase/LRE family protein [Pseudomonas sp. Gutcm_11s]